MQHKTYQTLVPNKVFESVIEEKKSKFLSFACHVKSKTEIDNFISTISVPHSKARHICYAWRIIEDNQVYQKSNDDGEPSGTAGKPILNIIEKNDLYNVCIIVVRYFGGVKLGAGNLLRTYSNSAKATIENALTTFSLIPVVQISIPYSHYSQALLLFPQNNIPYSFTKTNESAVFEIAPEQKEKAQAILLNAQLPCEMETIEKIEFL